MPNGLARDPDVTRRREGDHPSGLCRTSHRRPIQIEDRKSGGNQGGFMTLDPWPADPHATPAPARPPHRGPRHVRRSRRRRRRAGRRRRRHPAHAARRPQRGVLHQRDQRPAGRTTGRQARRQRRDVGAAQRWANQMANSNKLYHNPGSPLRSATGGTSARTWRRLLRLQPRGRVLRLDAAPRQHAGQGLHPDRRRRRRRPRQVLGGRGVPPADAQHQVGRRPRRHKAHQAPRPRAKRPSRST